MTSKIFSAPQAAGPISGAISIPGSKSLTNREILLSALAEGTSVLNKPLISRDSQLMLDAMKALGAEVTPRADSVKIAPATLNKDASIHCGLAGTVMRFVPLVAALNNGKITFDADKEAKARPLQGVFDALDQLGVNYEKGSDSFPFAVIGNAGTNATEVTLDASKSSQFVSALMLVAPKLEKGLVINHQGDSLPSIPHIEMTISCLEQRGVSVQKLSEASWKVFPGQISARDLVIEPDLSNAGAFLAAVMVAGGDLLVKDWPKQTTQVGKQYIEILGRMGAKFEFSSEGLKISSTGELHGIQADLSEAGELTPTIAALAALADTPSKLSGIAHLRGHETDRLRALAAEINRVGGDCVETEDGLVINPKKISGGEWRTYHDHRMATTGAILGLRAPIDIENVETTAKTMPDFKDMWLELIS